MNDSVFLAMYIGIDIFLVVILLGVLDICDRVRRIEKRLKEKEKTE